MDQTDNWTKRQTALVIELIRDYPLVNSCIQQLLFLEYCIILNCYLRCLWTVCPFFEVSNPEKNNIVKFIETYVGDRTVIPLVVLVFNLGFWSIGLYNLF